MPVRNSRLNSKPIPSTHEPTQYQSPSNGAVLIPRHRHGSAAIAAEWARATRYALLTPARRVRLTDLKPLAAGILPATSPSGTRLVVNFHSSLPFALRFPARQQAVEQAGEGGSRYHNKHDSWEVRAGVKLFSLRTRRVRLRRMILEIPR
jgi:hypothetical protein